MIPHENKVYGFVSVVVMNYKSKKTRFSGVLGVSSKHVSVRVLTDWSQLYMAVRCSTDSSISQTLIVWETVMFIFDVSLCRIR